MGFTLSDLSRYSIETPADRDMVVSYSFRNDSVAVAAVTSTSLTVPTIDVTDCDRSYSWI